MPRGPTKRRSKRPRARSARARWIAITKARSAVRCARIALWFFFAGRAQSSQTSLTLAQTAAPFQQTDDQRRWDLKLTATPLTNQTVQVQYLDRRQTEVRAVAADHDRSDRERSHRYARTPVRHELERRRAEPLLRDRAVLAEGQPSALRQHQHAAAGLAVPHDWPRRRRAACISDPRISIAPIPEDRDNNQLTGSVSYFGSRPGWGTHDVKAGVEVFSLVLRGGNSQSSTGYLFNTDYATAGGRPLTDATGRVVPVWIPGATSIGNTLPTRGAELDITTTSFYVQDRWTSGLAADARSRPALRARIEHGHGRRCRASTRGSIVPRLALAFQPRKDGRTVLGASYAHYAGRYTSSVFGRNTPVAQFGPRDERLQRSRGTGL